MEAAQIHLLLPLQARDNDSSQRHPVDKEVKTSTPYQT